MRRGSGATNPASPRSPSWATKAGSPYQRRRPNLKEQAEAAKEIREHMFGKYTREQFETASLATV